MIQQITVLLNYQTKAINWHFVVHTNLLESPVIVYADFESSLTPTGEEVTLHMHKANSACCYFVFTDDISSNKPYEFIGENCVIELLDTLKHTSC